MPFWSKASGSHILGANIGIRWTPHAALTRRACVSNELRGEYSLQQSNDVGACMGQGPHCRLSGVVARNCSASTLAHLRFMNFGNFHHSFKKRKAFSEFVEQHEFLSGQARSADGVALPLYSLVTCTCKYGTECNFRMQKLLSQNASLIAILIFYNENLR